MEIVFREALKELQQGKPCVLASVVSTRGSTPQKSGAKLLIRQDGTGAGTLGGGCVEGNVWYMAKTLLQSGQGALTTTYSLTEDIEARDGLLCGGSMQVLIDPIRDPSSFLPLLREILDAYEGERAVALCTLTKADDDPRLRPGSKLLIREDGSYSGALGDAPLDEEVRKRAADLLAQGTGAWFSISGGIEVLVETFASPPVLILMGAGHVNRAVAPLAKKVGFRVWVIDDRSEFASPDHFPEADGILAKDFLQGFAELKVNRNTYVVVGTRGHRDDDRALEAAARSPAGYLGMIGSRRKVLLIFQELMKRGIPRERIEAIHAPIGLDLHARTPVEIGVSIVAELMKFRFGGTGKSLKLGARQVEQARAREKKPEDQPVPEPGTLS